MCFGSEHVIDTIKVGQNWKQWMPPYKWCLKEETVLDVIPKTETVKLGNGNIKVFIVLAFNSARLYITPGRTSDEKI